MLLGIPDWFIIATSIILVAILFLDIFLAFRRPRVPTTRESVSWIIFYVALAVLFGCLLLLVSGGDAAGQFVAGWLTEYSLSLDNLFIFLLIMARFAVPHRQIQSMLMVGIILALIFRGIFIVAGVQLLGSFTWLFYIFSILIFYAAANQAFTTEKDEEHTENRLIRLLRRHVPVTARFHGARIRMSLNGRKVFTPALLVYATLGTADAVLAIDSIPAVFGITQDAFLIFTANIFALMGLRQLYFLLGTLVRRLKYLHYGIAAILGFIGIKLFITALHSNTLPFINGGEAFTAIPEIPTILSLCFIVASITAAVIASLMHMRRS